MGAKIDADGSKVLDSFFLSCSMFPAIKTLRSAKPGDDIVTVFGEDSKFFPAISKFSAFVGDSVAPDGVIRYFGGAEHYKKITEEGTVSGIWLPQKPPELMPFFHLALPLKDGVYVNKGIKLPLHNLVQLGSKGENEVAHLGFVFDAHCSEESLRGLLAEQAEKLPQVLKVMNSIAAYDFGEHAEMLQKILQRAKAFGL